VGPGKGHRNATTIGILSDDVLLEIFDRCRKGGDQYNESPFRVWQWHLLVHVCRRWRQIIFASPRYLDLQLLCTNGDPFREIMGIWPTIPIIVLCWSITGCGVEDEIIAALEHPDRVSRINLLVTRSHWGEIAVLMQEPFPVLTHLTFTSQFGNVSVLPDGFLGGSAPSLRQLDLCSVQYPALPTLLLSASNLVSLWLRNIPPTGYISPEAMASHVAASPKLVTLYIAFSVPASFPDLIISPPITRTVLPALCHFSFSGESKYLEDFVSRINTPQLNSIVVHYQRGDININFDVSQLSKFIDRSESLKRSLSKHCKITVDQGQDIVTFCVGRTTSERWNPKPGISVCLGTGIREHISHLTNILGFMSPILSDIVHCTIDSTRFMFKSESGQDDFDWLQLLRQLSSLQTLFVFDSIAGLISRALAHIDMGTITEMLPALRLLCIEDYQHASSVHNFLTVRRDSGHHVTFVETKEEFEERLRSYP
jgi:hypothetical protein